MRDRGKAIVGVSPTLIQWTQLDVICIGKWLIIGLRTGEIMKFETIEMKIVIENITKQRRLRGWSQAKLARETGLSQPYVLTLERGDHQDIALLTLQKLAKAFGLPVEFFLKKQD